MAAQCAAQLGGQTNRSLPDDQAMSNLETLQFLKAYL